MPEIVLISVYVLSLLIVRRIRGVWDFTLPARIAMAAMLVVTGLAHFFFTKGMTMMLPAFVPQKEMIIYMTGVAELAAAAGLLIPGLKRLTGWLLIIFFVALLPANINGALHHVDLQKATHDGRGVDYLWFRIPLQFVFIAWVYASVIRRPQV